MTYHELVGYIVFPFMLLMVLGCFLFVMLVEGEAPRFMQRWWNKRQKKKRARA